MSAIIHQPVGRRKSRSAWRASLGCSFLLFARHLSAAEHAESNVPPADVVHPALRHSEGLFASSNLVAVAPPAEPPKVDGSEVVLEEALREKAANNRDQAEKLFARVLEMRAPVEARKTALLELAVLAHEKSDLLRAQQIYAQFLRDFQGDRSAPEVLLRQGLLYREMGAPVMALAKFYAVMSSALNLKLERMDYYQRLVLRAQSEIADTYYLQGKHEEATDFFVRLLKLDSPDLDRPRILCKLIRCWNARGGFTEVVSHSRSFLERYSESSSAPEVRYLSATALFKLDRKDEALEQVLSLLQSQEQSAAEHPQGWNYWRQRTGNDIANHFYQQGSFSQALQIYQCLATLDPAPEWQLPALYQTGLVYERLRQPDKALEAYTQILEGRSKATQAFSPSLKAILDMASWRKTHLQWQQRADLAAARLLSPTPPETDHERQ